MQKPHIRHLECVARPSSERPRVALHALQDFMHDSSPIYISRKATLAVCKFTCWGQETSSPVGLKTICYKTCGFGKEVISEHPCYTPKVKELLFLIDECRAETVTLMFGWRWFNWHDRNSFAQVYYLRKGMYSDFFLRHFSPASLPYISPGYSCLTILRWACLFFWSLARTCSRSIMGWRQVYFSTIRLTFIFMQEFITYFVLFLGESRTFFFESTALVILLQNNLFYLFLTIMAMIYL